MSGRQRCIGYATTIGTTLPVSGAILVDSEGTAATIEIVEGRCDIATEGWAELGPYRASGDRLVFDCPGVARYLCEGGTRLTVEPVPGADPRIVSGMLIATALPALLWSRGDIVLHAAAAVLPGCATAVAIAGPSGAGKSTILEALVARGADVVADDSLCMRQQAETTWISGLPASYFLPPEGARDSRLVRRVDTARQRPSARLGAVLVIDVPQDDEPAFRRLRGTKALAMLLMHRHRPRVPRILKCEAVNLPQLATIASRLPVYAWQRRAGEPNLTRHEYDFIQSLGSTEA